MKYLVFALALLSFLASTTLGFPHGPNERNLRAATSTAPARTMATTVTQSINNWIEDVDTVNKFLNVALSLPIGAPLQSGASNALAFAQDEPVNVKFLKATPGIDAAGLSAASELEQVFGGVLDQLGNVVQHPLSLPVALNAVNQININRYAVFSSHCPRSNLSMQMQ